MLASPKEFDLLPVGRFAAQLRVSPATVEEIDQLYGPFAASLLEACADRDTVQRVAAHHPFNAWSIRVQRDEHLQGLYLMIMLTDVGHRALLDGSFTPIQPDPTHMARDLTDMSAIYKWGVFAKGIAAGAVPLIAAELRQAPFAHLPLYGRAATPEGGHLMEAVGFSQMTHSNLRSLYKYDRLKNRAIPFPTKTKTPENDHA